MNKNLTILLACTLLAGCYTEKKAVKQAVQAATTYPLPVGKIFRQLYPCDTTGVKITTDSTEFKKWEDSVKRLNAFYNEILDNIKPVEIHDTVLHVDSARCDDLKAQYKQNESKYKGIISVKDKQIAELQQKLKSIPPVEKNTNATVKDQSESKEIDVLNKNISDLNDTIGHRNKCILWLIVLLVISGSFNLLQFKKII